MCMSANSKQTDDMPSNEFLETIIAGKLVRLTMDYINDRIKVSSNNPENIGLLVTYLNNLALQKGFGKVILIAREEDWERTLPFGYILEAVNSGYYQGDSAYFMAKFYSKERANRNSLIVEDNILQAVLQRPLNPLPPRLPLGYVVRNAVVEDLPQLVHLYERVFATYPSPITEPEYLQHLINKYTFKIILHAGKIVASASAETDLENMAAELTDCACLPEYQGQGLMSYLILSLELDLVRRGFKNLYTICRAVSTGINTIFRKQGYTYGGRFINNCSICGQFEDMNLWIKDPLVIPA